MLSHDTPSSSYTQQLLTVHERSSDQLSHDVCALMTAILTAPDSRYAGSSQHLADHPLNFSKAELSAGALTLNARSNSRLPASGLRLRTPGNSSCRICAAGAPVKHAPATAQGRAKGRRQANTCTQHGTLLVTIKCLMELQRGISSAGRCAVPYQESEMQRARQRISAHFPIESSEMGGGAPGGRCKCSCARHRARAWRPSAGSAPWHPPGPAARAPPRPPGAPWRARCSDYSQADASRYCSLLQRQGSITHRGCGA